ncbi:MAG: Hpt domain-containing protein [Bacteriovorax sp.]|nr:Hpt domain-containing protein [Bacteriovorax sp.]
MNDEDQEFLISLQKDFIDETFDLLLKCEECLLNFEKNFDLSYFQEYMRIIHSIKGSSRAVEFDSIASTIHLIESLGQKSKDHSFVENSLWAIDGIREALELIKENKKDEMESKLALVVSKIK